jgi:hypothetical protein
MGGGAEPGIVEKEKEKKYSQYINDSLNLYPKFSCTVDIEGYADFMNQPIEFAVNKFSDARFEYMDYEYWACTLYNFEKEPNTNSKSDAYIIVANQDTPKIPVGIRSLTKNGLSFVQNQYVGRGSGWGFDPLWVHINVGRTVYQIICDIYNCPNIYYTLIRSTDVTYVTNVLKNANFTRETYYKTFFGMSLDDLLFKGYFQMNIKLPI